MPLPLFPYQEFGATWLASRERAALLDEPGSGKTCQVIRALDLRRAMRGVIIAPAHLRENWRVEFGKFAHISRKLCKAKTIHDFVAWSRGVFDVLILSYEMATRWKALFDREAEILDFLVCDESHYLKNLAAARTKAILGAEGDGCGGIAKWAVQAWLLTGTVMPNDPADVYPFLRFCHAVDGMSLPTFSRRYFWSQKGSWSVRNHPRADTVDELRAMITTNSIRRMLSDVGYELPPIHLTTTIVDGDTAQVRAMLLAHPGMEQAIIDAVKRGGLSQSFLDSQHISTLRRLVAEAKAIPYARMLVDELRSAPDRKMVVMGVSRQALQHIRDHLGEHGIWAVLVQGGISETARMENLRAFQESAECRVFVGNMAASGTGLTLTAAAHIDIFESTWTPGPNAQAIKRVRRIGQSRSQHARFIILADSIDEVVISIVASKTAAIARIEGDAMLAGPHEIADIWA